MFDMVARSIYLHAPCSTSCTVPFCNKQHSVGIILAFGICKGLRMESVLFELCVRKANLLFESVSAKTLEHNMLVAMRRNLPSSCRELFDFFPVKPRFLTDQR